jgi:opacity protein-like surface antigen
VIGLSGLALVAAPVSANETSAIAGTVAGAAVMGLVCAAAALYADEDEVDPEAYDRPGFFVGAGTNYAIEEFTGDVTAELDVAQFDPDADELRGEMTDEIEFDNSFGINGRFGYRCHSRFSVETEIEWTNGFEADIEKETSGKVGTTDLEPIVVTTNAKAYLMTGRIQPFLLAGLGLMRMEYKERDTTRDPVPSDKKQRYRKTRFAMKIGAGVDYYLTKNVVVGLDVDYVNGFSLDVDYVLIGGGVQYRF